MKRVWFIPIIIILLTACSGVKVTATPIPPMATLTQSTVPVNTPTQPPTQTLTITPSRTKTLTLIPTETKNRFLEIVDLSTLPSGDYLIFSGQEDNALNGLYIGSVDGEILGRISDYYAYMAVSPDLRFLAYTMSLGTNDYLKVMDLKTREFVFSTKSCSSPSWGNTSYELVAQCENGITYFAFDEEGNKESTLLVPGYPNFIDLKFSPDGKWIAYSFPARPPSAEIIGPLLVDMECLSEDSCNETPPINLQLSGYFIWSPDSKYLAITPNINWSDDYRLGSIYIVDISTGRIEDEMNTKEGRIDSFVWSPDGMKIAYISSADKNYYVDIFIIDLSSKEISNWEPDRNAKLDPWVLVDWISVP